MGDISRRYMPFEASFRSKIESGEYQVFTRYGNPVRVLAWDVKGPFPIVCIQDNVTNSRPFKVNEHGIVDTSDNTRHCADLKVAAVEDTELLTPWENAVRELIAETVGYDYWGKSIREKAKKLHELAYEEFREDRSSGTEYNQGRLDALKFIPKWKDVRKELPKDTDDVIAVCRNKNKEDGMYLYDVCTFFEGKWENRRNYEDVILWMHVDDLGKLPVEK